MVSKPTLQVYWITEVTHVSFASVSPSLRPFPWPNLAQDPADRSNLIGFTFQRPLCSVLGHNQQYINPQRRDTEQSLTEIQYTLSILQVYFVCTSKKKSTIEVYFIHTSRKKV